MNNSIYNKKYFKNEILIYIIRECLNKNRNWQNYPYVINYIAKIIKKKLLNFVK